MGVVLQSIFAIILSVEFMIGNLGNGFIALVNFMDWVERRKMSSVDRILTALAISRLGLLWLTFINWWKNLLFPDLLMSENPFRMTYISWTIISHFNNWLATSLSIFYFLKIGNFSNFILRYLKWRAKKVVSVSLLVSLVLLLSNIILMNTHVDIWIHGYKRNMSYISSVKNSAQFSKLLLLPNFMFTFIPFTISLTTFLLLIFSLWKHLKKMQQNAQGSRDTSTMAHVRALKNMIAFLLLYICFFLSFLVQIWKYEIMQVNLIDLFCHATGTVFPSAHSFVLIMGNRKLRHASVLMLWRLKCRSKDKILLPSYS
uniref:Taste receptor type 2 n=1 Tax=Castor canadensis TaxID=51338 RepID=A0A8C0VYC1_CASCN